MAISLKTMNCDQCGNQSEQTGNLRTHIERAKSWHLIGNWQHHSRFFAIFNFNSIQFQFWIFYCSIRTPQKVRTRCNKAYRESSPLSFSTSNCILVSFIRVWVVKKKRIMIIMPKLKRMIFIMTTAKYCDRYVEIKVNKMEIDIHTIHTFFSFWSDRY